MLSGAIPHTAFDPIFQRAQRIEAVGRWAAAAMAHPRNQEQAYKLRCGTVLYLVHLVGLLGACGLIGQVVLGIVLCIVLCCGFYRCCGSICVAWPAARTTLAALGRSAINCAVKRCAKACPVSDK